jgi:hypothetical protein
MFEFLKRKQSITRIAIDPPTAKAGREGIALVLIARNEARHIAEWARFHLTAGVRHIYLYDNGSTDGTAQTLTATAGTHATIMPWNQVLRDLRSGTEIHNQVLAYAHTVRNFGGQYRWISFIDTDEFLVPKLDRDLPSALARLGEARNIALPWHMFGRNGHMVPPAGGMVQNYTRRAADPMSRKRGICNFKCIADPCHITGISVHALQVDGSFDCVNDKGQHADLRNREKPKFYSADVLQLNHYYARSEQELAEKIGRGVFPSTKITGHGRRVRQIVENIEADEVEDRAAQDYLARTTLQ